jgi:hypothetical protein
MNSLTIDIRTKEMSGFRPVVFPPREIFKILRWLLKAFDKKHCPQKMLS